MEKQVREHRERSLQRRVIPRFTGKRILIVCEGGKTEPNYFKELIKTWRIHPAQVEIAGEECGSAPISVVEYAIQCREDNQQDTKQGRDVKIDDIWCVFDFDEHESINRAIDKAKAHHLKVALSVPCFEFWYLLHFIYTSRKFQKCDAVIKELKKKKRLPDYDKSQVDLDVLLPLLDAAFTNTERLRAENQKSGTDRPATDVDLLVRELMNVKHVR